MTFPPNSDDSPNPVDNMPAVRARVPEHVASGEISTGVIVVTGGTEYVLDFVRNLPRPNCVVSRVVLPHLVMPQFIDALTTNIELFRQRYGDLPGMLPASQPPANPENAIHNHGTPQNTNNLGAVNGSDPNAQQTGLPGQEPGHLGGSGYGQTGGGNTASKSTGIPEQGEGTGEPSGLGSNIPANSGASNGNGPNAANITRRQNPQEVYDDLKIRDEILSGAYANAVMIGHGPFEFSFDFITQFYPQPAVSARVFMASGHVVRLLDSLKTSWEQIRGRYGHPPKP